MNKSPQQIINEAAARAQLFDELCGSGCPECDGTLKPTALGYCTIACDRCEVTISTKQIDDAVEGARGD